MQRLHDDGQLERALHVLRAFNDLELGRGYPVVDQGLFRPRLVEANPQGQGIAPGVRDTPELAERGHVRLSAGAAQAFREVEDYVGLRVAQAQREIGVGLQPDHVADVGERGLYRRNRLLVIPFGERVLVAALSVRRGLLFYIGEYLGRYS